MNLSVCLIVRNEEGNLQRCVNSFKSIADEIIVTDTGSTDGTVELAKKLGAKVNYFSWCDDFSAARNYCFSQASGDWIFWIDADEELLPDSLEEVRHCLSRDDVFGYLVQRRDLTDLSNPDLYTVMWQERLFRNDKNIHHAGRCHSQFQPSLNELAAKKGQVIGNSKICIQHYGFAGPQRVEKIKRGLKLMELELAERPGQLYYQIELFRTLLLLGESRWRTVFDETISIVLPNIEDENPSIPQVALLLETLLQLPESQLPPELTKSKLCYLAERWFPRAAPLLWVLAKLDFQRNQFERAEERLRKLIQMGKEHSYDRTVGFEPGIFGDEAKLNLAVSLIRQVKLNEAVEILEFLSTSEKHAQAAKQNLNAIKKIRRGRSNNPRRNRRRR